MIGPLVLCWVTASRSCSNAVLHFTASGCLGVAQKQEPLSVCNPGFVGGCVVASAALLAAKHTEAAVTPQCQLVSGFTGSTACFALRAL